MHYKRYKTILSPKNGMNLYRGCSHGCIYCDSRSACYQFNHDFEDIEVKEDAPEMLEAELQKKRSRGMIATGSMCDPYLHLEEELGVTRLCLEVIARYGFGVALLTKSDRILRDIDLLVEINRRAKCVVQMTLTTFDEKLCSVVEPDVCTTARRVETLKILRQAGIPTVVWMTPILPFINDTAENIRGLLSYCAEAGVRGVIYFGAGVTLREGDREYFYAALDKNFPGLKGLYIKTFGNAYSCQSPDDRALTELFHKICGEYGISHDNGEIFNFMYSFNEPKILKQITFFD